MTSITGNATLDRLSNVGTAGATGTGKSSMGQDDFLRLMVAQLKTQDPFAPMDNQQMVAQMAQFSSVAGISEMNSSLKAMAEDLRGSRMGDAAGWIGRSALVASDVATPLADGSYSGQIALPEDAASIQLSLVDERGATVHSQNFTATKAGVVGFDWNGKGADGAAAAATGPLTLVVAAAGKTGFMETTTAAWATVTGVQSPAGGTASKLLTALGAIAPEDAISLS